MGFVILKAHRPINWPNNIYSKILPRAYKSVWQNPTLLFFLLPKNEFGLRYRLRSQPIRIRIRTGPPPLGSIRLHFPILLRIHRKSLRHQRRPLQDPIVPDVILLRRSVMFDMPGADPTRRPDLVLHLRLLLRLPPLLHPELGAPGLRLVRATRLHAPPDLAEQSGGGSTLELP